MRGKGNLGNGVPTESGMMHIAHSYKVETGLREAHADNRILQVAYGLHKDGEEEFLHKDINARIKADAIGLRAEDLTSKPSISTSSIPAMVQVPGDVINEFYATDELEVQALNAHPNEFIIYEDETSLSTLLWPKPPTQRPSCPGG